MKISRIRLYNVNQPKRTGGYSSGSGFKKTRDDTSVIVLIDTDEGLTGAGEICPIGAHYGEAFAEGATAGIPLLAEHLLGEDPLQVERLNYEWDRTLYGKLYIKAPVDTALWDIYGKAVDRPVCELLGGRWETPVPLYRSVLFPDTAPDDALAQPLIDCRGDGYHHFQLKVGVDVDADIRRVEACCDALLPGEVAVADANRRFTFYEALRFTEALKHQPVIIEQPCRTLDECIELRRHCSLPMKLDEVIETTEDFMRATRAGAMDICCIKVGRVGGLTRARRLRNLCVDLGLAVVADDIWGSEIVTAALTHFASSTPTQTVMSTTDLTDYVTVKTASGCPRPVNGAISASTAPGLGVEPLMDVLGDPVAVIE